MKKKINFWVCYIFYAFLLLCFFLFILCSVFLINTAMERDSRLSRDRVALCIVSANSSKVQIGIRDEDWTRWVWLKTKCFNHFPQATVQRQWLSSENIWNMCVPALRLITLWEKSVFFEPPHWPWVSFAVTEGVLKWLELLILISTCFPVPYNIKRRRSTAHRRAKDNMLTFTVSHSRFVFRSFLCLIVNTNLTSIFGGWHSRNSDHGNGGACRCSGW